MDMLQLIQSAKTPLDIANLLTMMGQTGQKSAPSLPATTNPMNLSSPREADLLLQSLGQTSSPRVEARPNIDPMWKAQGEFFGNDMLGLQDVEAARMLLNSMGQTGPMSQDPSQAQGDPATAQPQETVVPDDPVIDNVVSTALLQAATQEDPDAQYKDIEKTGKADTRGGAARVNEYSAVHGVTAVRGDDGRITLTNIGPDGKPSEASQKRTYGFNPLTSTTSGTVNKLLADIQTASPEEARGMASTLRVAVAEEESKIASQAMSFAEQQVGIPRIREQLKASEALDANSPGYMPGIGDSARTAKIRSALFNAQTQAEKVADTWMATNIGAAQLRAAKQNVEAQLGRLERAETTSTIRANERDAKRAELYDALSPQQKMLASKLNPELKNPADVVSYFERQLKIDPKFQELMEADPTEIPLLAVKGNTLARQVVVQEEAANTGRSADEVDREIREMAGLGVGKEAVRMWANAKAETSIGNKEEVRNGLNARYVALENATDKASKAEFKNLQAQIALDNFKLRRNMKFTGDVTSWGVMDPDLQAAIAKSQSTSGKTDIESVAIAYVASLTGAERAAAFNEFKNKVELAGARTTNSVFGPVNVLRAKALVDSIAIRDGGLARWFLNNYTVLQSPAAVANTPVVPWLAK